MSAAVHARNVLADLAAQGLVVFSVIVLATLAFAGRHHPAPATLAAPKPTPRQGADLQPNVTATAVIVGGGAAAAAPEAEK